MNPVVFAKSSLSLACRMAMELVNSCVNSLTQHCFLRRIPWEALVLHLWEETEMQKGQGLTRFSMPKSRNQLFSPNIWTMWEKAGGETLLLPQIYFWYSFVRFFMAVLTTYFRDLNPKLHGRIKWVLIFKGSIMSSQGNWEYSQMTMKGMNFITFLSHYDFVSAKNYEACTAIVPAIQNQLHGNCQTI